MAINAFHALFLNAPLKGWRGFVVLFGWGAVAKGTASLLIKSAGLLAT